MENIPRFANESEEADWWDVHQTQVEAEVSGLEKEYQTPNGLRYTKCGFSDKSGKRRMIVTVYRKKKPNIVRVLTAWEMGIPNS